MATTPPTRTLRGRDHERPGVVATAEVADGAVALGLTRGWRPKPYAYVDANEDVVSASADSAAQVLVVADGHNGQQASHVAVDAVIDLLGHDLRAADLSDDEMIDIALQIEHRIGEEVVDRGPRSRTTMVVALRTPTQLQWFGVGDSALLVIDSEHRVALPTTTRWFFGDDVRATALRRTLARGRSSVASSAWIALVTDGYTDYLPSPEPAAMVAARAIRAADTAGGAVDALLEQARQGGAGDNVGVVVSGPWYKRRDGHNHVLDRDG